MSKPAKKLNFRTRLDRLSAIVDELEQGEDLDLEVSLERFEEGRKLHAELMSQLDGFEKRLEVLVQDSGGATSTEPLAAPDDLDDDDA